MGRLAGSLAVNIGQRPTEILEVFRSPIEDLLLDTAILAEVIPQEGSVSSLSEEIERKRRRLISKGLRRRRYIT